MDSLIKAKAGLKTLGHKKSMPDSPEQAILETFPNPGVSLVIFTTKEFTSLCPVTGQPDWCTITIRYQPNTKCLESKSLKLYLQAFRSERAFMEELSVKIWARLNKELKPFYIKVLIESNPRGGVGLEAIKEGF